MVYEPMKAVTLYTELIHIYRHYVGRGFVSFFPCNFSCSVPRVVTCSIVVSSLSKIGPLREGTRNVVFSPSREQKMHCLNDKAKRGRGKENVSTA